MFSILSIVFFVFCVPDFREAQDFSHAELFVSNIILIAMLISVPALFKKLSKNTIIKLCVGGGLFGIAFGFKLTAIALIFGFAITVLLHNRIENKLIKLLSFLVPCFVVFFVMDFYWFYKVYLQFKNPFFPYFNIYSSAVVGKGDGMNKAVNDIRVAFQTLR